MAFAVGALALGAADASALEPGEQRGLAFATANCGPCHAVGGSGPSPVKSAPPFRILYERYPLETLAEALVEGIETGHPSMPEFRLDGAEIGDLIAYLKTFEAARR